MLSVVGIVVSIAAIMLLAFKNVPLYVYAPLCALIAAVASGINPYDALVTSFVPGLAEYVSKNFMLFLSSAVFAFFMDETGAAKYIALRLSSLAKRSKNSKFAGLMFMALVQIVLSVGGINLFVVIFLMVSLNRTMYEELDIPWNLFLANMWASGTVTVWALPGMPSIQNLIPTEYLGTDAMAGAGLGIIMGIEITVLCVGYVWYCLKKAEKNHEHFLPQGEKVKNAEINVNKEVPKNINMITALLPSAVVLVTMNVFKLAPAVSLFLGAFLSFVLFHKNIKNVAFTVRDGMENGLGVLLPVAFMAGYGTVIASTSGFGVIIDALKNIEGPEVVQVYIATNVAACICGSVSGGLGIVMTTLGEHFLAMDLSPGIIHRIAVAGASGLDTMPHAASIHSLMRVSCIEFNWQSYKHLFICNLALTMIVGLTGVALVCLGLFS